MCQEAWIKRVILSGVQNKELVQKIIGLNASSSLTDVVTLCRSYEAARSAASSCATSGTRSLPVQQTKAEARSVAFLSTSSCGDCDKLPYGFKGYPATEASCRGCGETGHWSHTERCSGRNDAQCNACGCYGYFEKLSKS